MRFTDQLILGIILLTNTTLSWSDEFRAILEPRYRTIITSEVVSVVKKIDKRMGQSFKKNDILLQLDNRIYSSNYQKAIALFEKAKADREAQERLFQDKVVSFADFDAAKANYAAAKAEVVLAEKAYEACTIRAPYDGAVQDLFVQEFERVEQGRKLMEILDDKTLHAKLVIPSNLLSHFKMGDTIHLWVAEANDDYPAKITEIAPAIDPSSSLVKITAMIDNKDVNLKPGMIGILKIDLPPPSVTVPNPIKPQSMTPQPTTQP